MSKRPDPSIAVQVKRIATLSAAFRACLHGDDTADVITCALLDSALRVARASQGMANGDTSVATATLLLIRELTHLAEDEANAERKEGGH